MILEITKFLESERNKKIIKAVFYLSLLALYLSLSLLFIYKIDSSKMDIIFGTDCYRVLKDWTESAYSHYRTKVHPLYVLFVYPVVSFMTFVFQDKVVSVAVLIAIVAVMNVLLLDKILKKLCSNNLFTNILRAVVVVFFAFSFTMLENTIIVESFLIGAFTLLLFWLYFLKLRDKKLEEQKFGVLDYMWLVCLGVLGFSMTVTNYAHFAVGTAFLFVLCKHKSVKSFFVEALKFVALHVVVIGVSALLCMLQKKIFPSSENAIKYFIDVIKDFLLGSTKSEEIKYISSGDEIGIISIYNLLKFCFVFSLFGYKTTTSWRGIRFTEFSAFNKFYLVVMLALFVFALVLIIKNKKHVAWPFVCTLLFEFVLHIFYGNNELMLYVLQILFLILIIMFIGLASWENKIMHLSVSGLFVVLTIINLIFNFKTIDFIGDYLTKNYVEPITNFGGVLVVSMLECAVIVLLYVLCKHLITKCIAHGESDENQEIEDASQKPKKKFYTFSKFSKIFVSVVASVIIVLQTICQICFISIDKKVQAQKDDLLVYIGEEKKLIYTNLKIPFGMGLRKKFVIEKLNQNIGGAVIYKYNPATKAKTNLYTNLTLLEYDSVNYTAKLKDEKNNKYLYMYENENGVYVSNGTSVTTLDNSTKINIPSFEGYEYADHMRALFGELMVNITAKGFSPNLYVYQDSSWYRDGALACMILEKTGNIQQVEAYIESLNENNVYDNARANYDKTPGVKEADNLGELLYMLSLVDNPNTSLVQAVVDEIKACTKINTSTGKKYIQGMTDGQTLSTYQTKWLLFAMENFGHDKLLQYGLDASEYSVEGKTDYYSDMCWFYNNSTKEEFSGDLEKIKEGLYDTSGEKDRWPYLNWARLHYYQIKIEMPELTYPMSREGRVSAMYGYCITHMWTASEMILYLYDYANFS